MSKREFDLRRALDSCLRRATPPTKIPDEWLDAIDEEPARLVAKEIAYVLIEAVRTQKIVPHVVERIAKLFAACRKEAHRTSPSALKSFDARLSFILKHVSHLVAEDAESAATCVEAASVFYKEVFKTDLPAANAMLDLLSKISLGPENTGQRKLNVHRKTKNHILVTACIRTGTLDMTHLEDCFLQSPSLRTLFITQVKEVDIGLNLDVAFSKSVRRFLSLPPRTDYPDVATQSTSLVELSTLFGSVLEPLQDEEEEGEEEEEEQESAAVVAVPVSLVQSPIKGRKRPEPYASSPLAPRRVKRIVEAYRVTRAAPRIDFEKARMEEKEQQKEEEEAAAAARRFPIDLLCHETLVFA